MDYFFVFFSKIYVFFYKDKGDYWKIFPTLIMSTITVINVQMILSFSFVLNKIFTFFLATVILCFFIVFNRKKDYNWVVRYPLSKKQKIIVVSFLIIDITIVTILSMISRDIYMTTHGIVR